MQAQQQPAAETAPVTAGTWGETERFVCKTGFSSLPQLCEGLFSSSSEFGIWISWSNEQLLKV